MSTDTRVTAIDIEFTGRGINVRSTTPAVTSGTLNVKLMQGARVVAEHAAWAEQGHQITWLSFGVTSAQAALVTNPAELSIAVTHTESPLDRLRELIGEHREEYSDDDGLHCGCSCKPGITTTGMDSRHHWYVEHLADLIAGAFRIEHR
jgi:hypothetical protein